MSSLLPVSSYAKVSAAARRSCRAGAKSRERDPVEKGCDGLKLFLRHGIKDHDEAISNPGKQVLKVVPKTIVDKGNRDLARSIESERQRADKLSRVLRTKVQRHDDAIAASGNRIKRLPSVKGLVDKGMQDIQTVASRTRRGAPLSEYSEVWTFHVTLVTYSTMVIAWASELAGSTYSSQLCGTVGFALGALFSFAHRAATVRIWKTPSSPLNVVVTGGTRGLGRAIVREHLIRGDNVFIASRSERAVREALSELQVSEHMQEFTQRPHQVNGFSADVSVPGSVSRLASLAQNNFADKTIDVWINNAGVSGSFKSFLDGSPEDIAKVARTNLLGALLCTRAAIKVMEHQERVGHVFNMDGAGADGMPTPQYAAYGATKAGIAQVMGSVAAELRENGIRVGVHTLSPGMVLTDLILDGATNRNKQVFNILCEQPEIAAAYLVPRARSVAARSDDQTYIRFLTSFKALTKFMSAPLLLGRYFTNDGETAYDEDESARLDSKATARAIHNAGAQGESLRYAYAISLCAAVMILSIDPTTVHLVAPRALPGVTAMLNMPVQLMHHFGL